VSSLLVFAAMSGCPLSTHVICPACIDHERDNSRCEWIGDTPFLLEPGNPAHQRHLVHDAQLAEGLAVRFADAEHKRLYGIEHHGGLFARTFAPSATGYIVISLALLALVFAIGLVGRVGDPREATAAY
jgi:hypothetical protein